MNFPTKSKKKYSDNNSIQPVNALINKNEIIRLRQDPNRYYLKGNIQLIIAANNISPTDDIIVIALADQDTPDTCALLVSENSYSLISLSDSGNIWYGKIQPTELWQKTNMLTLSLEKNKVCYFQSFGKANSTFLVPCSTLPISENFFLKGSVQQMNSAYKDFVPDYSEGSLFGKNIFGVTTNVEMHGMKTVSIRSKFKQGTKDDFTEGVERDESLMLLLKGQVGDVGVAANIYDSSVDMGEANKNNIDIHDKNWDLYFGEYTAYLDKAEFTAFNKLQDGVKGTLQDGLFNYILMKSESKGTSAHDQITGKNSQGPYKTSFQPIIIRSERVVLRGKVLVRDTDYTLDNTLGEITFKQDYILDTEVFTIDYEYANTLYKKNFTALRGEYVSSNNNEHYSITYLQEADENDGDTSAQSIAPQSHTMYGIEGQYSPLPNLSMQSELSLSNQNLDTNHPGYELSDIAWKQFFNYSNSIYSIKYLIRNVGSNFYSLGNPAIHPGQNTYCFDLAFSPVKSWQNHILQNKDSYILNDGEISETLSDMKTSYGSAYIGAYSRDNRDFSSSINLQEKLQTRYSTGIKYGLACVEVAPEYSLEKIEDYYDPSSSYTNQIAQLSTSLVGIDAVKLATNLEIQQRDLVSNQSFTRKVYSLSTEMSPISSVALDGTAKYVSDTEEGDSALADMNYSFSPMKQLKVNGNFNEETLLETFGTQNYKVAHFDSACKITLKPLSDLTLKASYRPSSAQIMDLANLSYDDKRITQYSADYSLQGILNNSISYKQSTRIDLDQNQIPTATISLDENKETWLVQSNFRTEEHDINYSLEINKENTAKLLSSTTSNIYEHYLFSQVTHYLDYTYQISSILKLGLNYKNDLSESLYAIDTSSNTNMLIETIGASSEWQATKYLILKLTASGAKSTDLSGVLPLTYLAIPRLDITYKPFNGMVTTAMIEKTNSLSGQEVQKTRISLNLRFNTSFAQLLDFTCSTQVDYEHSIVPTYYETLDMLVKLTMIF